MKSHKARFAVCAEPSGEEPREKGDLLGTLLLHGTVSRSRMPGKSTYCWSEISLLKLLCPVAGDSGYPVPPWFLNWTYNVNIAKKMYLNLTWAACSLGVAWLITLVVVHEHFSWNSVGRVKHFKALILNDVWKPITSYILISKINFSLTSGGSNSQFFRRWVN